MSEYFASKMVEWELAKEQAEKRAKWLGEEVERTKKIPEHCDINGVKHWTVWGAALFIAQRKYKDNEAREKAISKYFLELKQSIKQGDLFCFDRYGDLIPKARTAECTDALSTEDFESWLSASRYRSALARLNPAAEQKTKVEGEVERPSIKEPTGKAQLLVEACLAEFRKKNGGHPSSADQLIAFSVKNNPPGYEGLEDSGGNKRDRTIGWPSSRDPNKNDSVQWQSFLKAYKQLTDA